MTRQLRQRHRRIWFALLLLLPSLWGAGVFMRRPVPRMSGVGDWLAAPEASSAASGVRTNAGEVPAPSR